MATFLQLCQQTHRYLRIGEDAPGTAPKTVVGQPSKLNEIIGWVNDAYRDIQLDQRDWHFMKAVGEVTLPAGSRDVNPSTLLADYSRLIMTTAPCERRHILVRYATDSTLHDCHFIEWESWHPFERGHSSNSVGLAQYFTILPDQSLRMWPRASSDVVLNLAWRRKVNDLVHDDDVPVLPPDHHVAIVWRAVMFYMDTRDNTTDMYRKFERRRIQSMTRLYNESLPEVTL